MAARLVELAASYALAAAAILACLILVLATIALGELLAQEPHMPLPHVATPC